MEIEISVKSSGDPEISIGSHDRSCRISPREGKERNEDHLWVEALCKVIAWVGLQSVYKNRNRSSFAIGQI